MPAIWPMPSSPLESPTRRLARCLKISPRWTGNGWVMLCTTTGACCLVGLAFCKSTRYDHVQVGHRDINSSFAGSHWQTTWVWKAGFGWEDWSGRSYRNFQPNRHSILRSLGWDEHVPHPEDKWYEGGTSKVFGGANQVLSKGRS